VVKANSRSKSVTCGLLSLIMVSAGILHFVSPGFFVSIVPSYLPYPGALVAISGVCEIACGVGLLVRVVRLFSSWALIALLIAVFPANVNMALHPGHYSPAILWLRLPLQGVLIALAWWIGKPD
jgi:uncharacterized membrane protein